MGIVRKMEGNLLVLENSENGEFVRIRESIIDGQACIAPEGRLSMEMVHDLEDELTSMVLMCNRVTIDMSGVKYIANSVLQMILEIQHMTDARDGTLEIKSVGSDLWARFEEMGLEDIFDLEPAQESLQ